MVAFVDSRIAGVSDSQSKVVTTPIKAMTTGDVIFNVVGDIQILSLYSECYSANGVAASTLQYSVFTSTGAVSNISAASASLANAVAGTTVMLTAASTLSEVPVISATGVSINTASRGVRVPTGQIKLIVGVAPTTGTWKHYLKYEPLEVGAYAY